MQVGSHLGVTFHPPRGPHLSLFSVSDTVGVYPGGWSVVGVGPPGREVVGGKDVGFHGWTGGILSVRALVGGCFPVNSVFHCSGGEWPRLPVRVAQDEPVRVVPVVPRVLPTVLPLMRLATLSPVAVSGGGSEGRGARGGPRPARSGWQPVALRPLPHVVPRHTVPGSHVGRVVEEVVERLLDRRVPVVLR